MIQIQQLTYKYPGKSEFALREVQLEIPKGSLFGLLGPNGSGKTTLISLLCGILKPLSGSLRVADLEIGEHRREIQSFSALVPQDFAFYPRLSIAENLEFYAGVQGLKAAELKERIGVALETTGLTPQRGLRAEEASGGMKRRLNIAIALLRQPRILYLDEPTVGIDPQSRKFILRAIQGLSKTGCTVVYSSHYMEEVQELCDQIGILDRGRLLRQGSLKDLLRAKGGLKKAKNLEERFMQLTKHGLRD